MSRSWKKFLAGQLIVIEGPDGVGKTTTSRLLDERLRGKGISSSLLAFPGRQPNTLGNLVYRLHHDPAAVGVSGITPLAVQAMHIAAHIDAIERIIRPKLHAGMTVILDRFWWSTSVYGVVGGCQTHPLKLLIEVERLAWGDTAPCVAFLLCRDTPIDRPKEDRGRWQRLVEEYQRLGRREDNDYPVKALDNSSSPPRCVDLMLSVLDELRAGHSEQLKLSIAKEDKKDLPVEEKLQRPAPATPLHILPVRPTVAYDTYWKFAAERQAVFFRRVEGLPPPWTADPVISEYKFTNAYRASDRVSQYLIRSVIYRDDLPSTNEEVFFRVMLFKFFNKIETWKTLESVLGSITHEEYAFDQYDRVLSGLMADGQAIYSAAYIMPSGGKSLGHDRKYRNHLTLLERMMADSLPKKLASAPSMQRAFTLLREYPTLGDFLAYQYVTDLNYSEIINFRESDFVVPGPGALDGLRKCFADPGGLNDAELIKFMAERQEKEFERLGLNFQSLWGRPLQLIDCQNLFCEVDKYSRVRHPELVGRSGRLRIKQRFGATPDFPTPWYPPKWGINDRIKKGEDNPAKATPKSAKLLTKQERLWR